MQSKRLAYLDQVRGYAVFGMILVNVLGLFDGIPWMFTHHHEGFSYADHIAPLFVFIVGMGFRGSFQKTVDLEGLGRARRRAARRYLIICGLGLLYGGFDLTVSIWDALMDIGVSGLLALLFMHRSTTVRIAAGCGFLALYQAVFSLTGYGEWVVDTSINGGPLGPLSWAFILLLGSAADDWTRNRSRNAITARLLAATAALSLAGWLVRAGWSDFKPVWHFSPYAMTAPYPLYAAGLSFFCILIFYWICEVWGARLPLLTPMGKNPLVLYLLQAILVLVAEFLISDSLGILPAFGLFMTVLCICYGVGRYLEIKGCIIKIG